MNLQRMQGKVAIITGAAHTYDVLLAGGGIMGCAIAYNLLKCEPTLRVLIIERDSSYARSSTILSDGNTRIQFNLKENILISLYGLEVLATFAEEFATKDHTPVINFCQQGNLYLVAEAGRDFAQQGVALQKSLGCDIEWLAAEQIQEHYPLYQGSDNVVGATFGPKDGTMSPGDVLMGYRRKAIALGATVVEAEIAELLKVGDRMSGLRLTSGEVYHAPIVANVAGAWAPILAETVGVTLPIKAIKREVYSVLAPRAFDKILPMLLLPNGQYIFHEGENNYITGGALPADPVTYTDFSWSLERFKANLWEGLVDYLPDFDRLKVTNGWAGLYDVNTLDGNAILGEWPTLRGYYCANGFSGHGFQQAHAVGRYLAELMLGQTPTLDLAIFSPQRILDNHPVYENPARLI